MTQADRVLSTPPLNTPMDPTRRRFLTVAAVGSMVGAGTLAAAAFTPNDVPQAVAMPTVGSSPALRAAIARLAEAHVNLIGAKATAEEAEAMWTDWEAQNPQPASKRGHPEMDQEGKRLPCERHSAIVASLDGRRNHLRRGPGRGRQCPDCRRRRRSGDGRVFASMTRWSSTATTGPRSPAWSRRNISGLVRRCNHEQRHPASHGPAQAHG
jgi:hypothetical protein